MSFGCTRRSRGTGTLRYTTGRNDPNRGLFSCIFSQYVNELWRVATDLYQWDLYTH
jgi:hypothetical protein